MMLRPVRSSFKLAARWRTRTPWNETDTGRWRFHSLVWRSSGSNLSFFSRAVKRRSSLGRKTICVSSSFRASRHAESASSSLNAYLSRISARRSCHLPRRPRRHRFCARRDSKTLSSYSYSPRIPSACAPLQTRRVRTYPTTIEQVDTCGGWNIHTALKPLQSIPPLFPPKTTFTLHLH